MNEWGFETKAIHSGLHPSQHADATSIPIYATHRLPMIRR